MTTNLNTLHNKIKNPSNYIIDIGASTGVNSDPVYNFITNSKYNGLCVEGDNNKIYHLRNVTKFDICNEYVTPSNIINIFTKFNVPVNIDILKVDIDGYDLEVIRQILKVYKPKIIIAEINEKIPPPILFEVLYKDNYNWDYSHCFGFSIKSGEYVMKKYGYNIIDIYELNNIICVNDELYNVLYLENPINNVEELYNIKYVLNQKRLIDLPWNDNVNYWLEIKDKDKLKYEITNYFCNVNDRSKFINKTKILNVDFMIE
jgi:hypothetical protein